MVCKSIQREKLFSSYVLSIFLVFGLAAMSIIITVNVASGFFHDNKPQKPEMQLNPVIQNEFDTLYEKYPDITQNDIDVSYNILVQDCLDYSDDETDNFMSEFICKGITTGLMQNYLETLGLKLEPSTAEYGNVGKSPQLWD